MENIILPPKDSWSALCKRPLLDIPNIEKPVRAILNRVRIEGDKALRDYSKQFDKVETGDLRVSPEEIEEAERLVPESLKIAIGIAKNNIEVFHKAQVCKTEIVETVAGVRCWRKNVPVEKTGLYIPGGSAPLFSTVLMLAVPASIAGCRRIIICTPPDQTGKVSPVLLYSAGICGIKEIFKAGGAQAVGAMAYGTETIPKVDKIFGPGNQYVTRAKEIVQSEGVAIDMPAGPSEVLVIADESANPAFIAADLLSQAEHGPDSQVVLVSDSSSLLNKVKREVDTQLQSLPRKSIAGHSLLNSLAILLNNLDECIEFSNTYAPEHLIINTKNADLLADKVINAGSVFLGSFSCESAGDYASGPNHTLPTNGFAKTFSGVSVDSFVKKITFQELTAKGIMNLGPAVEILAQAEGLEGHKNAVTIRLKSIKND
ncbi:MAG TPA: histidinol dehydrogenase [Bacteroidales bacterium]|nr:histidinol dehydrogenase [Bacteroidales bacterium]